MAVIVAFQRKRGKRTDSLSSKMSITNSETLTSASRIPTEVESLNKRRFAAPSRFIQHLCVLSGGSSPGSRMRSSGCRPLRRTRNRGRSQIHHSHAWGCDDTWWCQHRVMCANCKKDDTFWFSGQSSVLQVISLQPAVVTHRSVPPVPLALLTAWLPREDSNFRERYFPCSPCTFVVFRLCTRQLQLHRTVLPTGRFAETCDGHHRYHKRITLTCDACVQGKKKGPALVAKDQSSQRTQTRADRCSVAPTNTVLLNNPTFFSCLL